MTSAKLEIKIGINVDCKYTEPESEGQQGKNINNSKFKIQNSKLKTFSDGDLNPD
ncbi:MAG: hypothetical protein HWQ41_01330 [Nostoc sp. NOS(2021)]|uniref:hypothetical protein n=1 Tax=Nostoc sp. NOS(2021) TaxID=2815407 RepID=UPI0025CDE4B9|nr:hypothetical protein [Nostoc sp. NOS(2021)]MBN3893976.1 hypothetical protein [Nostoc sp. NOS(2021)]